MAASLWVLLAILFVLIALGVVVAIATKQRKKTPPDYYTFFVMGISWIIMGMILEEMQFFFIMGLVFAALGMAYKKDWKKNHKTWDQLSDGERKLKLSLVITLTVLLLIGIVLFMMVNVGMI